jgi:triacylglycerol esterase/lipase EstA (alpha/beta hydrolase family)
MNIEVGMFVRTTKSPKIRKIVDIATNEFGTNFYQIDLPIGEQLFDNEIFKSSFNIIDLIEKGDYVNGMEVISTHKEYKNGELYKNYITTYDCSDYGSQDYYEKDIKEILTKEQYEQNVYKL